MLTGKVGGEVSPDEAVECAQQCALNAIAAVKAELGDLDAGQAGRQGRGLRRVARPTSPASRRSRTAPPSCSARSSATPACTPGRRSAYPCCRSTRRSRSSWSSRSEPCCGSRCRRTWSSRRGSTPTAPRQPAEPRDRRDRRTAAAVGRGPGGLPAAPADVDGLRRRHVRLPRRRGRPARLRRTPSPGPDRPPPTGRRRLGVDEAEARALVCAAVRETLRGVGRAAGRHLADGRGRRHHRRRLGGRPGRAGVPRAVDDGLPATAAGWCCAPTCWASGRGWLTPVFEPRRYRTWFFVAVAAGGPADAGRVVRVVVGRPGCRRWRRSTAVDAGELPMLPPTYLTCLEVGQYADAGRRAGRGGRPRASTCSPPRWSARRDEVDPVHAGPAAPLVEASGP